VTRSLYVGLDPEQFAISPDGRRLYVANEDSGLMSAVDVASGKILDTQIVGIEPEGVSVSPDGRWVYVTAESSNTVSVYDTRKQAIAASFLVDARPRVAVFSRDGSRAWVTSEVGGTVSEVDTRKHVVTRKLELPRGSKPVGIAVSRDDATLYIANGRANNVAVVNAGKLALVRTIPVGQRPWGIAISPDGRHVYAANSLSNTISVIDTRSDSVVATIPTGNGPWGIAIGASASLTDGRDNSAGDPVARVAGGSSLQVVGVPVNQDARTVQVKKRVMSPALHRDATQHRLHTTGSVGPDHEIGHVARMSMLSVPAVVRLAPGVEMRAGRGELGRVAFSHFVHVDPVSARSEPSHVDRDVNVVAGRFEPRLSDRQARCILDFGPGAGGACRTATRYAHQKNRTAQQDKRSQTHSRVWDSGSC
jgi:YVTN family beta-propeller protein